VPFLIKDGVQDYAGIPTSYGSRSMAGVVPARHSHVVERYLKAGWSSSARRICPSLRFAG
jgi:amidase